MNTSTPDYKIAIVAPCHVQPTEQWINSLKSVAKDHSVIIVDDSDGKIIYPSEWDVYGYARQEEELGSEMYEEFKKFHKSSACRNFGHWIAYKKGFDIIIGLDSDCDVPPDFISKHLEALMSTAYGWVNPIRNTNWFPRGFPYHERSKKVILNIGLWENELDVNGIDRVHAGVPPKTPMIDKQEIAHAMIPLCGMNFACWAHAIPGFLFIPDFDSGEEKFRRYDDIWGGYIFQKLMQKADEKITYGFPIVYHDTVVVAEEDAQKETSGIAFEESFYQMVDKMCKDIQYSSYARMFEQFNKNASLLKGTAFSSLIPSFNLWQKMFEEKKENE